MSGETYTKGPWRADISEYWGYQPRVYAGDEKHGQLICCVGNAEEWDQYVTEWEANTCLIAAAPELLSSLRELCNRLGPRWFLEQNWAEPLAVIAKAEGREA